jgi:hypothetical protein
LRITKAKSDKRSRLEAQLVAAFVTLGCLVFFILINRPQEQPPVKIATVPVATPEPPVEKRTPAIDPNAQFREVPSRWAPIDFRHHSYGQYKFSTERKLNLTLKNGEYEYDFSESSGWFWLHDVYYVDVTDDQIPEAIVDVAHVECGGGSCDGGANLFFIYSINAGGKLKQLLRYETGSYAYGCGLKSLTLEGKEVRFELFGRCPRPAMENPGPQKFMVKDLTHVIFWYTHKGFIELEPEFYSTQVQDLRNYTAEVHIKD